MSSFLNSVQSVALILFLTATGFFCSYKGWFKNEAKAFISKFLLSFAVPFTCIYSLRSRLTLDMIRSAGTMLLVPFINISLLFITSAIVAKLLKLPKRTMGVFIVECAMSNTLFIGFPMCTELFGNDAIIYVIMFYMVSTCFTQMVANSLIMVTGDIRGQVSTAKFAKKVITSPPIIGIIVGFAIVLADLNPPAIFMTYAKYMNNLVTPLALLIAGKIIYDLGLKNIRINKLIVLIMIFRFVISPGMCYMLCRAFGVDGLARNVFIIQAAMPILTQTVVSATEYKADEELAAQGNAITTLAMFVVIPVLMLFLV